MSFKYITSPKSSTPTPKPPLIQTRNLPLLATPKHCSGKTYIVTGANCGLGFEAAKHLVALGSAKVILAVRNLSSGEEAKSKIDADTNTNDVAEVWHLDLADYGSIKTFTQKAVAELEYIDGLIANASVASMKKEFVNEQNDNVSINVIGTYLLGFQLFGKLSETAKARKTPSHLTIVSSRAGFDVKEVWEVIKESPLERMKTVELGQAGYPLSKLIETLVAREFAALVPVENSGVIVNVICPGLCITQLDRNAPSEFRKKLAELRADRGRTAEDGSRTLLHGVVAGGETHGLLLHSCEIGEPDVPQWVKDEEGLRQQKKTWEVVRAELERVEPGVVAALGV